MRHIPTVHNRENQNRNEATGSHKPIAFDTAGRTACMTTVAGSCRPRKRGRNSFVKCYPHSQGPFLSTFPKTPPAFLRSCPVVTPNNFFFLLNTPPRRPKRSHRPYPAKTLPRSNSRNQTPCEFPAWLLPRMPQHPIHPHGVFCAAEVIHGWKYIGKPPLTTFCARTKFSS